jgi:hypothetical protein
MYFTYLILFNILYVCVHTERQTDTERDSVQCT